MTLAQVLTDFIKQAVSWHLQHQLPLVTWANVEDPSPCQLGAVIKQQVQWQPVPQQTKTSFANVEQALEIKLHADIITFYSEYFGAGITAEHSLGKLDLLMVWNEADILRLQENIIGHILMKRRLKQRETVFFATTDNDELVLSVLNSTGEVYLEKVGQEVVTKLADDLATFLLQLKPASH